MPKTICFDLRPLQIGHENRGIGMVVKSILTNLEDSNNKYIFYVFDSSNPVDDLKIELSITNYTFVTTPAAKTTVDDPKDIIAAFKLAYHRFSNLKALKPDIFVQFDFTLGIPHWRRTKTVCIAYDLIPLIMRNEYLPNVRTVWNQGGGRKARLKAAVRATYYRLKYKKYYSNFKHADRLISISNATKQSFIDLLGIDSSKIATIPLAPVALKAKVDNSIANSIKKPYVFYIGGTDNRKRVEEVVYAFNIAKSRGQDIALVLAGNEFKTPESLPSITARNAIMASPYRQDIHLVGFVSDGQKKGLYRNALAFVFCSVYEGFGLPVLEAQAEGCPVITYNNSSIPEVSSESVQLVENSNYVAIANALPGIRARDREVLVKNGLEFSVQFSWNAYVKKLTAQF